MGGDFTAGKSQDTRKGIYALAGMFDLYYFTCYNLPKVKIYFHLPKCWLWRGNQWCRICWRSVHFEISAVKTWRFPCESIQCAFWCYANHQKVVMNKFKICRIIPTITSVPELSLQQFVVFAPRWTQQIYFFSARRVSIPDEARQSTAEPRCVRQFFRDIQRKGTPCTVKW